MLIQCSNLFDDGNVCLRVVLTLCSGGSFLVRRSVFVIVYITLRVVLTSGGPLV